VVGSGSSGLSDPRGGAAIDRHEAVFRFNRAQTAGYEGYVGSKTTILLGNIITTRMFLQAITQSTQPNARVALNAQGWNGEEYIHWPSTTKGTSTVRRLCNVLHDPPFYVMRPTLVEDFLAIYREICNLTQTYQLPPECAPASAPEVFSRAKLTYGACVVFVGLSCHHNDDVLDAHTGQVTYATACPPG
jgi:hypothetical protein